MNCASGHERPAKFECLKCGQLWCEQCVVPLSPHSHVQTCPSCRDMARPIVHRPRPQELWSRVPEAIGAPFRAPAIWVVAICTGFLLASFGLNFLHPYAWAGTLLIVLAYLNGYAASVAQASAHGQRDEYDWDVTDDPVQKVFIPSIRCAIVAVIAIAPAVLGFRVSPAVGLAVSVTSVAWFPMAWLRTILAERMLAALSPAVWIAIARTFPHYVALVMPAMALVLSPILLFLLAPAPEAVPSAVVIAPGFVAGARLLGLLYLHHGERIDWFGEAARYYTPIHAERP